MDFKLTPQNVWHQNAVCAIRNANLDNDSSLERQWYGNELKEIVDNSQCEREIFLWILNLLDESYIGLYPEITFKEPKVNIAWYKLAKENPSAILAEHIQTLGPNTTQQQFVLVALDDDEMHKSVVPAEIQRWMDVLINIARQDALGKIDYSEVNVYAEMNLGNLINLFHEWHDLIDLGYWDNDKSLMQNLISANISPQRCLQFAVDTAQIPRQEIMGRLPAAYRNDAWGPILGKSENQRGYGNSGIVKFSNMANASQFMRLTLQSALVNISDPSENDLKQRREIMSHIASRDVILDIAKWRYVTDYLGWFHASHKYVKDGVTTRHHGHDFLSSIMAMPSEELVLPPSVIMQSSIEEKHNKLLHDLAKYSFPQLPAELVAALPAGIEHISSPAELYSEGSSMHHCCGGSGYLSDTSRGDCVFFHCTTGEDVSGCTIQLEFDHHGDDKLSMHVEQSRGLSNRSLTNKEAEFEEKLLQVMNKYCAENPKWIEEALAASKALIPEGVDLDDDYNDWDD